MTNSSAPEFFAGVDVQIARGLAYCVLTREAEYCTSGWIDVHEYSEAALKLKDRLLTCAEGQSQRLAVGIDAPRKPIPTPRAFYWEKPKDTWRPRRPSDKGYGRHCEVVLKSLNLGNIQWTPPRHKAPEWMNLGFALYNALNEWEKVYEVFPTAAYRLLEGDVETRMSIPLAHFRRGPKDMLDAAAAAFSVLLFERGAGMEIGGGDGLGTIVLPDKVDVNPVVARWPQS